MRNNLLPIKILSERKGILVDLGSSFLFYKLLEYGLEITEPKIQISILHYFLVSLKCLIILVLANSFSLK